MQQNELPETASEAERRSDWAYYYELHRRRRWNSSLVLLRRLTWFAWGALVALWADAFIRNGFVEAWHIWALAAVCVYTVFVDLRLKPDGEEEVAKWLAMVRLNGFDTRGDIDDVLISYWEAERLVKEGWLKPNREEGLYHPLDCGWDVLLGLHARGWKRVGYD